MPELNSTVSVLPSSTAVQAVRGQLEAAGIESAVVEADGAFRLQVSENDFTRAMQLLFPIPTAPQLAALEAPGAGPWKCSHCGEEVQPVSNVCWACGKARDAAPGETAPAISPVAAAPPSAPPPAASPPAAPPFVAGISPTAAPHVVAAQPAVAAGRSVTTATPQVQETFATAPSTPAKDAAATDAPRRKRSSREPTIEEPNPWREPWLIGLWVLIGVSICVIAWLALR
ncbi:MAG TPA: hypothetical protein VHB99_13965 [Pirellulales bacterium]|nr:hypothetical protein [Pirellulales bacterium]